MIEHERSFVFTWESAKSFLEDQGIDIGTPNERIEDYYIEKGFRIRKVWSSAGGLQYFVTTKSGEKSRGYRVEREKEINAEAGEILLDRTTLTVKKDRYIIKPPQASSHDLDSYDVTFDFIEQPLRIAVLEVEAHSQVVYPIPADITKKLFEVDLRECPLCAYSLFKRKIGICGGPSSGKSETAKILSHILNTRFKGNAFHVTEFATTFIQKYNRNPEFLDQFFVWYGQHEREEDAKCANIVISDCPTFLAYIYMLLLQKFDFCSESALYLSKIYKRVLFDLQSYSDIIFMKIKEYEENNIRYQTKEEALSIEHRISMFLEDHKVPHTTATYNDVEDIITNLFYIN